MEDYMRMTQLDMGTKAYFDEMVKSGKYKKTLWTSLCDEPINLGGGGGVADTDPGSSSSSQQSTISGPLPIRFPSSVKENAPSGTDNRKPEVRKVSIAPLYCGLLSFSVFYFISESTLFSIIKRNHKIETISG